jgi:hypothetical protein
MVPASYLTVLDDAELEAMEKRDDVLASCDGCSGV